MLVRRVAADDAPGGARGGRRRRPSPGCDTTVTSAPSPTDDLDDRGQRGGAGVVEHDDRLRLCAPKRSVDVAGLGRRRRPRRRARRRSARSPRCRRARRPAGSWAPRPGRAPRTGLLGTQAADAAQADGPRRRSTPLDADALGGVPRHAVVDGPSKRRVGVQATQPLQRGEAPDLLAAGGHRVVGDVERALRVQVGLDLVRPRGQTGQIP